LAWRRLADHTAGNIAVNNGGKLGSGTASLSAFSTSTSLEHPGDSAALQDLPGFRETSWVAVGFHRFSKLPVRRFNFLPILVLVP
jgi:hypothetical protein